MARESRWGKGLSGERQAEAYLTGLGMRLLNRRYRAEDGEIDLILSEGDTVVFVEVKHRPRGQAGDGLLAITPAKRRRMLHAAAAWLAEHPDWPGPARFDAVEITSGGLRHVPDAFREEAEPRR